MLHIFITGNKLVFCTENHKQQDFSI